MADATTRIHLDCWEPGKGVPVTSDMSCLGVRNGGKVPADVLGAKCLGDGLDEIRL